LRKQEALIAAGVELLARQRDIISDLEREVHDAAHDTLRVFLETQALHEADRKCSD
jgi:hypothetical protein